MTRVQAALVAMDTIRLGVLSWELKWCAVMEASVCM